MNYQRIYNQFISDRKARELELKASGEYFERHHITPKSLGGTDSEDNLIRLTPEDHLFAHLLLAKWHNNRPYVGGGVSDVDRRQPRRGMASVHVTNRQSSYRLRDCSKEVFCEMFIPVEHQAEHRALGLRTTPPGEKRGRSGLRLTISAPPVKARDADPEYFERLVGFLRGIVYGKSVVSKSPSK